MEKRFGVSKMKTRKKCGYWQCNKPAKVLIGDVKQPHLPTNYCLCEEHAKELLDLLLEKYPKPCEYEVGEDEVVRVEVPVENEPDVVQVRTNKRLDGLVRTIYNANGKLTKADMVDICLNNGIDFGEEDAASVKITTMLEMLFPNLELDKPIEE